MTCDLPIIVRTKPPCAPADRRCGLRSWAISGLAHFTVFGAFLGEAAWRSTIPVPAGNLKSAGVALQASFDDFDTALSVREGEIAASFAAATVPPSANAPPTDSIVDVAARVEASLTSQTAAAGGRSAEENRAQLERLGDRLGAVSNEQSVGEMAAKFQQWLGTDRRAMKPAEEPVAGEFDFQTAQLHEIRRERGLDGEWRYASVLVDAAGRTFEAPMDEVEGQSAYETMEIVKKNPLMELVYRKIAMSLLDDLIKSGQKLEKARQEVEAAQHK